MRRYQSHCGAVQGNFDEGEDPDDYEGESDGDSDASDDAAAGRGTSNSKGD